MLHTFIILTVVAVIFVMLDLIFGFNGNTSKKESRFIRFVQGLVCVMVLIMVYHLVVDAHYIVNGTDFMEYFYSLYFVISLLCSIGLGSSFIIDVICKLMNKKK